MTMPDLPTPITVEGNRLMFTRVMLIAYGEACFAAGQQHSQVNQIKPNDDVSKLFKSFGVAK